jgi:hypothetical protein
MLVGQLRERLEDVSDDAVVQVDIHRAAVRDAPSRSPAHVADVEIRDGAVALVVDPAEDPGREKELRSRVEAAGMSLRQATSWEPPPSGAHRGDWVIHHEGRDHPFATFEAAEAWLVERGY